MLAKLKLSTKIAIVRVIRMLAAIISQVPPLRRFIVSIFVHLPYFNRRLRRIIEAGKGSYMAFDKRAAADNLLVGQLTPRARKLHQRYQDIKARDDQNSD